MNPGTITLATDFGTVDPYVAQMKGVLLSAAPGVPIIDLTHELPAFDVGAAAFFVRALPEWFPPGTVHVVVVDPGVGGLRRAVVVANRRQFILGPDNGVFHFLRGRQGVTAAVLPPPAPTAAPTFHGRDLFAPWAARLVTDPSTFDALPGLAAAQLVALKGEGGSAAGERASGADRRFPDGVSPASADATGRGLSGVVVRIDRFGNCITDIEGAALSAGSGEWWQLTLQPRVPCGPPGATFSGADRPGGAEAGNRLLRRVRSYCEVPIDQLAVLVGSQGLVEIACRESSASQMLGITTGCRVQLVARIEESQK